MAHRHRKSHPEPTRARRRRTRVVSFVALLAAVVTTMATFAQPGDRSILAMAEAVEVNPNFDIRTFKVDPRWEGNEAAAAFMVRLAPEAGLRSDLAATRIAGVAELEKAYKGLDIEENAALGGTEVVSMEPGAGFLTPASGDRVGALRGFLSANADAYGISAAQAAELVLVADYMNPAGNMGYVEFEQQLQRNPGVPGPHSRRLHGQGRAGADDGCAGHRRRRVGAADHAGGERGSRRVAGRGHGGLAGGRERPGADGGATAPR